MLDSMTAAFHGKTVESVQTIPFNADAFVPFLVSIKFTDGSKMSIEAACLDMAWASAGGHPICARYPA